MDIQKTLAMKLLEGKKVAYKAMSYPADLRDAEEVAEALNLSPATVYKTLVVSRASPAKSILIMIPANKKLNLKKLAKEVNEKKLKMASQKEAETLTGLQVGGISALALINRGFSVYIDRSAKALEQITVSAGQRGIQVSLSPDDLVRLTKARYVEGC